MEGPGTLHWTSDLSDLVGEPVADALGRLRSRADGIGTTGQLLAAPIDPSLADTAAFCARYGVPPAQSANCVVIAGRRADVTSYAACVVLATTRADVNGTVRRLLGARKASFAPMDDAVRLTGMEYGGITPVGVPAGWPILVDRAVVDSEVVVIGSGLRRSKLAVSGAALADLPGAQVVDGLAS